MSYQKIAQKLQYITVKILTKYEIIRFYNSHIHRKCDCEENTFEQKHLKRIEVSTKRKSAVDRLEKNCQFADQI